MSPKRLAECYKWSLSHPLACIVLLLGCFLLIQWQVSHPVIRFSDPAANYWVFLATLLLPWFALHYVFMVRTRWTRLLLSGLFIPVLLFTLALAILTTSWVIHAVKHGVDDSCQPIARVGMGSSQVVIYRTDAGALTAVGIMVRQERTLIPGVLLVRELEDFSPAYTASYHVIGPDTLRVEVRHYNNNAVAGVGTYHLKRFLYF